MWHFATVVKRCSPSMKTGTRNVWSGGMRVAAIGVIVQKRIAFADVALVIFGDIRTCRCAPKIWTGRSFGGSQKLVIARDDAAGEISRRRDHCRARRTQQRVGHLANDAVEPVGDHRYHHRIEFRRRFRCGRPSCELSLLMTPFSRPMRAPVLLADAGFVTADDFFERMGISRRPGCNDRMR